MFGSLYIILSKYIRPVSGNRLEYVLCCSKDREMVKEENCIDVISVSKCLKSALVKLYDILENKHIIVTRS